MIIKPKYLILLLTMIVVAFCYNSAKTASTEVTISEDRFDDTPAIDSTVGEMDHIGCSVYRSHSVKSGETIEVIFDSLGVERQQTYEIYKHFKNVGLPALYPNDSLGCLFDQKGDVVEVSLLSRQRYWYRVFISDKGYTATKTAVPITTQVYVLKGTIETTLSQDMLNHGVGYGIAAQFMDIFSWDINFIVSPRKGDRFNVVFEKKLINGESIGYGNILAAQYITSDYTYMAYGVKNSDGKMVYYDNEGKSLRKQFLKAPLKYSRISSGFSYKRKHPILGIVRPHLGIDYAAPTGTPIQAPASGVITYSGTMRGYGKHIRIKHPNGWETYYGHLDKIYRGMNKGRRVKQGDIIGTVGETGLATGPHLDYRMKHNGTFVNPLTVKTAAEGGVAVKDKERFTQKRLHFDIVFNERYPEDGCFLEKIDSPRGEKMLAAFIDNSML